jgi:hypothetical protein
VSRGERFLLEEVDHRAVLAVHQDEAAVVGRPPHRLEDRRVVDHPGARIGHEHLETRGAVRDQVVQGREVLIGQIDDDLVEAPIHDGLALGATGPLLVGHAGVLPLVLHREVDDARRPADRGGDRPRLEVVRRHRPFQRRVEVRVRVDATGQHELAARVDDPRVDVGERPDR